MMSWTTKSLISISDHLAQRNLYTNPICFPCAFRLTTGLSFCYHLQITLTDSTILCRSIRRRTRSNNNLREKDGRVSFFLVAVWWSCQIEFLYEKNIIFLCHYNRLKARFNKFFIPLRLMLYVFLSDI